MAKRISQNKVFEAIGYDPHDAQKIFHAARAKARFRIMDAGRRTGKSTAGGHELVPFAYEAYFKRDILDPHENRMEYWIVGPEYSDAEKEFRVLWNDIKKLKMPMDNPGSYNVPLASNMHLSLWGGKFQVHAKSAKNPENLVGEGLDGVILAEAAKLKRSIWIKYIRPMLADKRGWANLTSTPEGKNWFYEEFMKGISDDPAFSEYFGLKVPSWSNNHLFPGGRYDPEIVSMESGMTQEAFKQEIGAEFTEFVGRVFKEFDEELHCKSLKWNPDFETYAAVDYGWTNPFVWLVVQVDHWNNVYVIDELYGSHKRIDEVHHEILREGLLPPNLRLFAPDPASPGDTRILENNLHISAMGNTGGEVKDRITLIRNKLAIPPHLRHLADDHPEKLPKLFVDPDKCPNFVREFNDYRYPEKKTDADRNDSELPMKKDDHTPEALGRLFKALWGAEETQGAAYVASSSMG
jgi:hypothetical protein